MFTRKTLAEHLNTLHKKKSFSNKRSKSKFTPQDIAQYLKKGQLPDKYGGNKLELVDYNGVKFIKLHGSKS